MKETLIQLGLGMLTSALLGGVKILAPGLWEKVPKLLRPLLTTVLGALASGGATVATDAAASVVTAAATGALGGAAGKVVRDTAVEMYKGGNE